MNLGRTAIIMRDGWHSAECNPGKEELLLHSGNCTNFSNGNITGDLRICCPTREGKIRFCQALDSILNEVRDTKPTTNTKYHGRVDFIHPELAFEVVNGISIEAVD